MLERKDLFNPMGATLTGEKQYRARGYSVVERIEAPLGNGGVLAHRKNDQAGLGFERPDALDCLTQQPALVVAIEKRHGVPYDG